jgi:hypothetical protein
LPPAQQQRFRSIPRKEKDFKRIFDEYSDPVSYRQKFLDQNAFLVYYTKGYDGPGRPPLEAGGTIENERQTMQYGLRNDVWSTYENFIIEYEYCCNRKDDDDGEEDGSFADMMKYLSDTIDGIDEYLKLAPSEDVIEATKKITHDKQ